MLHIILGILTIILTILKWLGFLLLILLLLALILVLIVLLVPVRYRGRGEKTMEKLGGKLSATWLLRLIVIKAAIDSGGGNLEIRFFGKTPEAWRALLKKQKRNKGKKKPKSAAQNAKRRRPAETIKRTQTKQPEEAVKRTQPEQSAEAVKRTPPAERLEISKKESWQKDEKKAAEHAASGDADGSKISHIFRALKKIVGRSAKVVQSIRDAVPKMIEKIFRIVQQPGAFLQFWEKYEVGEVLREGKKELFALLAHYRPRHLVGYVKFGTGDPAQTGELTGILYLILPTQEYEIVPNFEELQFETETEFSGQIRGIHLLVTAYHLFRNKKLKRLIRKVRKKGE